MQGTSKTRLPQSTARQKTTKAISRQSWNSSAPDPVVVSSFAVPLPSAACTGNNGWRTWRMRQISYRSTSGCLESLVLELGLLLGPGLMFRCLLTGQRSTRRLLCRVPRAVPGRGTQGNCARMDCRACWDVAAAMPPKLSAQYLHGPSRPQWALHSAKGKLNGQSSAVFDFQRCCVGGDGRHVPLAEGTSNLQVILDSLRKDNMFMLSLTQQIPLLVDPDGEGVASLRALRPGLVWHTIGLHEPNSIVRSLEAVAAGGRVLLQVRERALDLRQLAVLASSYQVRMASVGLQASGSRGDTQRRAGRVLLSSRNWNSFRI